MEHKNEPLEKDVFVWNWSFNYVKFSFQGVFHLNYTGCCPPPNATFPQEIKGPWFRDLPPRSLNNGIRFPGFLGVIGLGELPLDSRLKLNPAWWFCQSVNLSPQHSMEVVWQQTKQYVVFMTYSAKGQSNRSSNFIFPTKYVTPKSSKDSHLVESNDFVLRCGSQFFLSVWYAVYATPAPLKPHQTYEKWLECSNPNIQNTPRMEKWILI